jgi:transcriptional regulator with XRE-family HTH domain
MDLDIKLEKPKKRPFKWTRDLIKLAINEGWTQTEIAEKCRTQQSIVSAWLKGNALANEHQLLPLLEIFGHKLRRSKFKVYWSLTPDTNEKSFYRVEGEVILSQVFFCMKRDNYGKIIRKTPTTKIVVHHQGKQQFIIVGQDRIKLNSKEDLECSVEDAIWSSTISAPQNASQVIASIDKFAEDIPLEFQNDYMTLPFLIRRALINYGFNIDGVENFPAPW